ncbi:PH domain-containing protein [Clostridium sp. MCC353]|uniref:PH domain-containing protein n=1 Tax=Clostridium sp. MCC353 TaxID=2592646 RepID=UPI001C01B667|nr:PH domain-containing protein [Clostridium sp. MCC353]MBT9776969.1 PH domain-containing protein [Clostridium sp. MCC353]
MDDNKDIIVWKDRKHHLWFPWSFTKYYIQNDRLMIQSGLFNTTLDETLLYRIVDITLKQSLGGKIFGTGSIIIKAKVDHTPEIILQNIAKPVKVRNMLSELVEDSRQKRNVVGKEFYGQNGHACMEHGESDEFDDYDFDNR